MPIPSDLISERQCLYDGWYRFSHLEVTLASGHRVERHLIDNGGAVAVLPFDPVRRTAILVSQLRAAVLDAGAPPLLEAIAGGLQGEDPEAQARTEALEEAGLRLGSLDAVATVWPIPAVSTERVALYLASYQAADRVSAGGGTGPDEQITVHEIPLDELRRLVLSGELTDAKTLILAYALILRRPDLWPPA